MRQVAHTAEAVLAGNEDDRSRPSTDWYRSEIRQLGLAFNTMLEDLRRRNADIRLALRDAETSNLAKTQFLANMSHEIRTPLNGVVGMIELLRLSGPSPLQQRYLDAATQSSHALLRLIDDVLDLSKIEAGKLELEHAPFHLPSLVHDARALFSDQASAKGLTLSASIADEANVVLLGDPHRLLQILTNLVSNALKFTSEGGVTIAVTCLEDRGSALRIAFPVSDSGIGVSASKQEEIFNAFSQADSSTTRRYGGTGLGLSIARQLCHAMGGEIGVDSAVGTGSVFWFTVVLDKQSPPIALPEPAAADASPASATSPLSASSAVVSAAQREFMAALHRTRAQQPLASFWSRTTGPISGSPRRCWKPSDALSVTARNGLEAISAYRENSVDLILMDCQMPEMDGYEAARSIRQIETFRSGTHRSWH